MFRDAAAIFAKDMQIERRSRVGLGQVIPFALTMLLLFGFALDPDRGTLEAAAAGLFWVAVLLSAVLTTQRSYAVESAGAGASLDGLRTLDMDPAAIFLGKTAGIAVQLALLQVVLAAGVVVLYDVDLTGLGVLVVTIVLATLALGAASALYGAVAAGARGRESLVPLLLMPSLGPVLLAATRATEYAFAASPSLAWPWVQLLGVIAAGFLVMGVATYAALLEGDA